MLPQLLSSILAISPPYITNLMFHSVLLVVPKVPNAKPNFQIRCVKQTPFLLRLESS